MKNKISRNEIDRIVYSFKTRHKEGYMHEEITTLLDTYFPNITDKMVFEKMGVHTAMSINGYTVTYHSDISLAIRCILENRNPSVFEWD